LLEVISRPGNGFQFSYSPAFGPGTRVRRALVNGELTEPAPRPDLPVFRQTEQCVFPPFHLGGRDIVEIELEPTVEILPPLSECQVGDFDKGLKIIRIDLSGKDLKAVVEGLAGESYALRITHGELVQDVVGAAVLGNRVTIKFPAGNEPEFVRREFTLKLK
jgi:hypothetical protein